MAEGASAAAVGVECGICHEEGLDEVGELDCCSHRFCFTCIAQWADIESRCPFCKARFTKIVRKLLPTSPADLPASPKAHGKLPGIVLETVEVPERNQTISDEADLAAEDPMANVVCMHCGGGDNDECLMLCDGCDRAMHTYCAGLAAVPEEDWYCPDCVAARVEEAAAATAIGVRSRAVRALRRSSRTAAGGVSGGDSVSPSPGRRQGRGGRTASLSYDEIAEVEGSPLGGAAVAVPAPARRRLRRAPPSPPTNMAQQRPTPARSMNGIATQTRSTGRTVFSRRESAQEQRISQLVGQMNRALSRGGSSHGETAAHRAVEQLRGNWESIRRAAAATSGSGRLGPRDGALGQASRQGPASSASSPLAAARGRTSAAAVDATWAAFERLASSSASIRRSEKAEETDTVSAAQMRRELAEARERGRQLGPSGRVAASGTSSSRRRPSTRRVLPMVQAAAARTSRPLPAPRSPLASPRRRPAELPPSEVDDAWAWDSTHSRSRSPRSPRLGQNHGFSNGVDRRRADSRSGQRGAVLARQNSSNANGSQQQQPSQQQGPSSSHHPSLLPRMQENGDHRLLSPPAADVISATSQQPRRHPWLDSPPEAQQGKGDGSNSHPPWPRPHQGRSPHAQPSSGGARRQPSPSFPAPAAQPSPYQQVYSRPAASAAPPPPIVRPQPSYSSAMGIIASQSQPGHSEVHQPPPAGSASVGLPQRSDDSSDHSSSSNLSGSTAHLSIMRQPPVPVSGAQNDTPLSSLQQRGSDRRRGRKRSDLPPHAETAAASKRLAGEASSGADPTRGSTLAPAQARAFKDAAAAKVKALLKPRFEEGSIDRGQFKAAAQTATRALWRRRQQAGGSELDGLVEGVVRTAVNDALEGLGLPAV